MTPEANRQILRNLTINSSEPNYQNTPTSTASSGRLAVLIIHANMRALGFHLKSCYRLYRNTTTGVVKTFIYTYKQVLLQGYLVNQLND